MTIGLELTLGNSFSQSSSLEYSITFKRSFVFLCSSMVIGRFSHQTSWGRHGRAHLLPLWHSSALGCAQIRLLPASLPAGRPASQLFHCSSPLQCLSRGRFQITTMESVWRACSVQRACATSIPQSRTRHGDNRHCYSGSLQVSTELDAVQMHR